MFVVQVRLVMISRMAKPEEVLVIETEQGEVVREFMKDTDAINMYKSMRETLGRPSISVYMYTSPGSHGFPNMNYACNWREHREPHIVEVNVNSVCRYVIN